MLNRHGTFIWYELLTSDVGAAALFYGTVVGWQAVPVGPSANDYRRFEIGGRGVGGLTKQTMGPGPCWLSYVGVQDVDAAVERIRTAGGGVHVPPTDIPGIGRFAMVNDPQGAVFYVMRGASAEPSAAFAPQHVGHGAWNELHTVQAEQAFAFYREVFGWRALDALDMGPMGRYQLFANSSDEALGGIMNSPNFPRPSWLTYFQVEDIDAAAQRVLRNGGQLTREPSEVPGGGWIIQGVDPQGAIFALTGTRGAAAQ